MNTHDLSALLNRAAAALETPDDLTDDDRKALIEDLCIAAGGRRVAADPPGYTAVSSNGLLSCEGCCFSQNQIPHCKVHDDLAFQCRGIDRADGRTVIFVKDPP